jgi:cytochrome b
MNERYKVWDLPVRLFHWALVALVIAQWASAEWHWIDMEWHFRLGYATLALLLFRILWGVFGSANARFAAFVRSPAAVVAYVRTALQPKRAPQVGHNPLGGWSVLAMLGVLLFQAVTGLFAYDDVDEAGPLAKHLPLAWAKRFTHWHEGGKNVVIALVVLHVIGVLYHHVRMRDDLIGPMIRGTKALPEDPQLRFSHGLFALFLLMASAAVVWFVTSL